MRSDSTIMPRNHKAARRVALLESQVNPATSPTACLVIRWDDGSSEMRG